MKDKYLNFPVQILQDALNDIHETMSNILNYAGYAHTLKLNGNQAKRMDDAGSYFGITWGNTTRCYNNGEMLYNSLPENSPMTGINKDVCFDFYKNYRSEERRVGKKFR